MPALLHRPRLLLAAGACLTLVFSATSPASPASPSVIRLAGCSYEEVKQAVAAAPDGSTVLIGPGVCKWGNQPAVKRAAGIKLRGAGADQTVIWRDGKVPDHTGRDAFLFEFDCANGKTVDISGLALRGNDMFFANDDEKATDYDSGLALMHGCRDFRIHDARFSQFSYYGILVSGTKARGVIDSNRFYANWKCQNPNVSCLGYSVGVLGDHDWPAWNLGSEQAVFIEDNHFEDGRHEVASNYGSRYVFRHNTVLRTGNPPGVEEPFRWQSPVDAHGPQSEGDTGSRGWEIHDNRFVLGAGKTGVPPDGTNVQTAGIRGGDGVFFCNRHDAGDSNFRWYVPIQTYENDSCEAGKIYPYQTKRAYYWANSGDLVSGFPHKVDIRAACVVAGQHVFFTAPDGYRPYTYPHPLRGLPGEPPSRCLSSP